MSSKNHIWQPKERLGRSDWLANVEEQVRFGSNFYVSKMKTNRATCDEGLI